MPNSLSFKTITQHCFAFFNRSATFESELYNLNYA